MSDATEPFGIAIARMTDAGWTPERTDAQLVPFLRDSRQFVAFESERHASLAILGRCSAEQELEELMIISGLYAAQVQLINKITPKVVKRVKRGRANDDDARFLSWAKEWIRVGEIDSANRFRQRDDSIARIDPALAESIRARAQRRADSILERTRH